MSRIFLSVIPALMVVTLGFPSPAKAVDPVVAYAGKFLLNKVLVDPLWDAVTGKPNVRLLDERLRELESNAALRSELRDEVRKLRASIDDRVTRDEFRRRFEQMNAEIGIIKLRLDDVEERVEKLEVENEDLKNRTRNAMNADYFRRRGEAYEKQSQSYKAIACYNLAVRLAPADARARCSRSQYYINLGAAGVGMPDAEEAIRLDPKSALAYQCRGTGNLQEQDYTGAVADLTKSLELDPKQGVKTYVLRADAYSRSGAYDRAVADSTDAIRLDPKNPRAYCVRGTSSFFLKDYPQAVADGTEAIRLDPKNPEAYCVRALGYYARYQLTLKDFFSDTPKRKERRLAFVDCTEALRLDPNCAQAHYIQGAVGKNVADFDMTTSYAEAVRLDPKYANSYFNREYAEAFAHKGEVEADGRSYPGHHDRAITFYNKAIEVDPTCAYAFYKRGCSFYQKDDFDMASKDFNESLRIGSTYDANCKEHLEWMTRKEVQERRFKRQ